eukprot:PITA_29072
MSSAMDEQTQQFSSIIDKLIPNGSNNLEVQDRYILPPHERPHKSEISYSESLPVVDLKDLDGPNRMAVVHQIRRVCEEDGFFQILNHGVAENVRKSTMGIAKEFFEMPVEDRACLYSEDLKQPVRLSTNLILKSIRDIADKYACEVRALILKLLAAISEALELESDYLDRILGNHNQRRNLNYDPSCPNPDLTLGSICMQVPSLC